MCLITVSGAAGPQGCAGDNEMLRSSICHAALLFSITAFVIGVDVLVMQCAMWSVAEHISASHLGSLLPTSYRPI